MRKIILLAMLILISASSAGAYTVPAEYRTSEHMNDIEVYQVSVQHQDTHWGFDNLRQLGQQYTNHGYPRDLTELEMKMNYYTELMKLRGGK